MPRLLVNPGTPQQWEIHLKPGSNKLGRSPASDVQIDHDSVSGTHCDIAVNGESVTVKDLGSTNGTFLDRAPVQEARLTAGQRLQLGGVEMEFVADPPRVAGPVVVRLAASGPPAAPAPPLPTSPRAGLRLAAQEATPAPPSVPAAYVPDEYSVEPSGPAMCKYHPRSAAHFLCPHCQIHFCELCVASRPRGERTGKYCRRCSNECVALNVQIVPVADPKANFFAAVPGAFVYPFKNATGILFLVFGTIVFSVFEIFLGFSLIRAWYVKIFILGYTFAYMQKIIHAAAQGEDDPPGWPDITEFVQDLLVPGLQLLGTMVVCFGPAIGLTIWVAVEAVGGRGPSPETALLILALALFGMVYFPMAVLAVAMYDSVLAVSPLIVVPAIYKLPLEYLLVLMVAGLTVAARLLGVVLLPRVVPLIVVPSLIGMFFGLYFLTVLMRLLGLMYYAKRDKLGWLGRRTR